MQQNRERRGVRSEDDNLTDAAVEGLGRFVGALLQLAVVRGLLDEVQNLLREGCVGDGPGGVGGGHSLFAMVVLGVGMGGIGVAEVRLAQIAAGSRPSWWN